MIRKFYRTVMRGFALVTGAYLARAVQKQFGLLGLLLFPFVMVGFMAFVGVGVIYTGLGTLVGAMYTDYMMSVSEPFSRELPVDSEGYLVVSLEDLKNWSLHKKHAGKYVMVSERFVVVEKKDIRIESSKSSIARSFGIDEGGSRPFGIIKFDVIEQSRFPEYRKAIVVNPGIVEKNKELNQKNVNHDNSDLAALITPDDLVFDTIKTNQTGEHPNYVFVGCDLQTPCNAKLSAKLLPVNPILRGLYYAWNWRDKYMLQEERWMLDGATEKNHN